jgi:DHA1 family tetracycline resistance protein-like MFS transporter
MTRRVSASEQGELQGAIASLRGIGMIFGPGMFSGTFAVFLAREHFLPGAPWYLAALLLLAALGVAWKTTGHVPASVESAGAAQPTDMSLMSKGSMD